MRASKVMILSRKKLKSKSFFTSPSLLMPSKLYLQFNAFFFFVAGILRNHGEILHAGHHPPGGFVVIVKKIILCGTYYRNMKNEKQYLNVIIQYFIHNKN
jgi:hypothetical protein